MNNIEKQEIIDTPKTIIFKAKKALTKSQFDLLYDMVKKQNADVNADIVLVPHSVDLEMEYKEEFVDEEKSKNINLEEMSIEELKEYAAKNEINIGRATSVDGILEKIEESKKEE